uniref:Uncharacterized protein n=1 Tax=Oryza punctata TaxID=4537 RepID=A0A0E0KH77_ORYPU
MEFASSILHVIGGLPTAPDDRGALLAFVITVVPRPSICRSGSPWCNAGHAMMEASHRRRVTSTFLECLARSSKGIVDDHYRGFIDLVGFHPYKEVVFLSQSLRRGLAFHLNSSKIQDLGHLEHHQQHPKILSPKFWFWES